LSFLERLPLSEAGLVEQQAPAAKPARREHIPLGIAYMIAATVLFAGSAAATKWLLATYPVGEVLFVRTVGSLAVVAAIILPFTGLAVLRTSRFTAHGVRALSQGTSQTLIVLAISLLPLASAFAINFSAPLFATLVSAVVLREKVGGARWAALAVGFAGVLIITNPGTGTFQLGALFALANAIMYGSVTAGVRGMTTTESAETLTMYQMLLLTLFFAFMLPLGFVMPTPIDWAAMLLSGVANGLGQYWWTRALHLAPVGAVAPFHYFMLVWTIVLGFAIWHDVPTPTLLIGSAIVVASGLFLLWRETRRV
jgi:drug/metabolite transporter (DMT)-like permease